MQSLPTAREARDHFIDEINRHAIPPQPVDFLSDAPSSDGLPNWMPNVATTGWCITPHWIEAATGDPLHQRSEYCVVLNSSDGATQLVIEHGDALVVTPDGSVYTLIQPSALGDIPAPQTPAAVIDVDDCDSGRLISVLLWGAEFLVQEAEERRADEASMAAAIPKLMTAVQDLNIPASPQQFYYCIPGQHLDLPGGSVQFCEVRQQTVTRLAATGRPEVEGWIVKQRRPQGTYLTEFVVTPAGTIYCLDLDGADPAEVDLPEPLCWPADDLESFEAGTFLAALEDTLEWLPLEHAVR